MLKGAFVFVGIVSLAVGCGDAPGDAALEGEVMKIHFERSGGFTGMTTNVEIDAQALSDAQREVLTTHLANAEFFALPSTIADPSTTSADRYNYRITIETDDRTHTVECTDGSAPASLTPLLNWLNNSARHTARSPTT